MTDVDVRTVETFQRDGVVLLQGVFRDWIDRLRAGVERNLRDPGPFGRDYLEDGKNGRFFGDYCNWARIDEPGVYRGKCTELCGRGHGFMPVVVKAVPPAEFEDWLAGQKQARTETAGDPVVAEAEQ